MSVFDSLTEAATREQQNLTAWRIIRERKDDRQQAFESAWKGAVEICRDLRQPSAFQRFLLLSATLKEWGRLGYLRGCRQNITDLRAELSQKRDRGEYWRRTLELCFIELVLDAADGIDRAEWQDQAEQAKSVSSYDFGLHLASSNVWDYVKERHLKAMVDCGYDRSSQRYVGQVSDSNPQVSIASSKSDSREERQLRRANLDHWGVGLDEKSQWQLFFRGRVKGPWRLYGRVEVPPGLVHYVLMLFADNGGSAEKHQLVDKLRVHGKTVHEIMESRVTPTLSKLRKAIKTSIQRARKLDEIEDPLPPPRDSSGTWIARITIGLAQPADTLPGKHGDKLTMSRKLTLVTAEQRCSI